MPCGCGDVKQETPIRSVLMNRRLLWAAGTPTSEEPPRGFFVGAQHLFLSIIWNFIGRSEDDGKVLEGVENQVSLAV